MTMTGNFKYWPVFSNIPQMTQEKHQKHLKPMQDTQNSQSHYSLLVSAGGHYLRSLFVRKKRPYDEIYSAIKPLVDRMNTIQALRTIASCHGHWYGKPKCHFPFPLYENSGFQLSVISHSIDFLSKKWVPEAGHPSCLLGRYA